MSYVVTLWDALVVSRHVDADSPALAARRFDECLGIYGREYCPAGRRSEMPDLGRHFNCYHVHNTRTGWVGWIAAYGQYSLGPRSKGEPARSKLLDRCRPERRCARDIACGVHP